MTRSSCVSRCERKPKDSHHPVHPRQAHQAMVLEMARESSRDGIRPGSRTPANIDIKTRKIERRLTRSTHILANTSSPRSTSLNCRVRSQSFLRKRQPQFTEILAARQRVSTWSAWMMASRASKKSGRHCCSFIPLSTGRTARKFPCFGTS